MPPQPNSDGLPFAVAPRAPVTRIRQRNAAELRHPTGARTQPMRGFDADFTDIVDYIVRITEQIWVDRAIGRIYDYYDHACTVYTQEGVVRSVEEVIAGTVTTLNAYPDGETHHLNVAWSGDETRGFYTSHLGLARSTNLGATFYGPATGKRIARRFCADCIQSNNRIHTEWLVRDNGAAVRQMGLDVHEIARKVAALPRAETNILSVPTRLNGQAPQQTLDEPADTMEGFVHHMFHNLWNLRRLDFLSQYYATDVIAHSGGGRTVFGLRNLSALILLILAGLPDATASVQHVCHAEETDGFILAVRWVLSGTTRPGGFLGDVPAGRGVAMMCATHLRFALGRIVEEWTVFDEVGVLADAYRA
jgi:predicted ester cyclase